MMVYENGSIGNEKAETANQPHFLGKKYSQPVTLSTSVAFNYKIIIAAKSPMNIVNLNQVSD